MKPRSLLAGSPGTKGNRSDRKLRSGSEIFGLYVSGYSNLSSVLRLNAEQPLSLTISAR